MNEQTMNAEQLLAHLAWMEVTAGYEPDFTQLICDERNVLTARMQRGDDEGVARQVVEIRRVLAMWPQGSRRKA